MATRSAAASLNSISELVIPSVQAARLPFQPVARNKRSRDRAAVHRLGDEASSVMATRSAAASLDSISELVIPRTQTARPPLQPVARKKRSRDRAALHRLGDEASSVMATRSAAASLNSISELVIPRTQTARPPLQPVARNKRSRDRAAVHRLGDEASSVMAKRSAATSLDSISEVVIPRAQTARLPLQPVAKNTRPQIPIDAHR
jgi:hypothetical protein